MKYRLLCFRKAVTEVRVGLCLSVFICWRVLAKSLSLDIALIVMGASQMMKVPARRYLSHCS